MASTPTAYQADFETPTPHGFPAATAPMLAGFARASKAYGIWHDIRVLEGRARKRADAATQPWSLSTWLCGFAGRCVRAFAREVRVRRDTRQLRQMSDRMLKDIGLTRAEVGGAVRYCRG